MNSKIPCEQAGWQAEFNTCFLKFFCRSSFKLGLFWIALLWLNIIFLPKWPWQQAQRSLWSCSWKGPVLAQHFTKLGSGSWCSAPCMFTWELPARILAGRSCQKVRICRCRDAWEWGGKSCRCLSSLPPTWSCFQAGCRDKGKWGTRHQLW